MRYKTIESMREHINDMRAERLQIMDLYHPMDNCEERRKLHKKATSLLYKIHDLEHRLSRLL